MSSSYRVLKLQSGEEIIAKITGKEGQKIVLDNPMIFTTQMRNSPFGQTHEITFLKDWLVNINKDVVKIPENFIVSWNTPTTDVSKLYDAERQNKMKRNLQGKDDKHEQIKSLDKILEDLKKLEDQIDQNEKDMQQPPETPDKGIFMSMMLPPDFIKTLMEEGYLDMEDLGFPEEMDIGDFYEEINDHVYTGDDINHPDYGNRWTDWNPDPRSDEYEEGGL